MNLRRAGSHGVLLIALCLLTVITAWAQVDKGVVDSFSNSIRNLQEQIQSYNCTCPDCGPDGPAIIAECQAFRAQDMKTLAGIRSDYATYLKQAGTPSIGPYSPPTKPSVPAPSPFEVPDSQSNFEKLVERTGNVKDAYGFLVHGQPALPFSDLWDLFSFARDIPWVDALGKTFGAAFGVFGYLMTPEELGCAVGRETCAGYLPPDTAAHLFDNVDFLSTGQQPGVAVFSSTPKQSGVAVFAPADRPSSSGFRTNHVVDVPGTAIFSSQPTKDWSALDKAVTQDLPQQDLKDYLSQGNGDGVAVFSPLAPTPARRSFIERESASEPGTQQSASGGRSFFIGLLEQAPAISQGIWGPKPTVQVPASVPRTPQAAARTAQQVPQGAQRMPQTTPSPAVAQPSVCNPSATASAHGVTKNGPYVTGPNAPSSSYTPLCSK